MAERISLDELLAILAPEDESERALIREALGPTFGIPAGQSMRPETRAKLLHETHQETALRVLNDGDDVNHVVEAGATVEVFEGASRGDAIDFMPPMTVRRRSRYAKNIYEVRGGGGGADCMFDVLVSSCFADLDNFTEGDSFTTVSGCVFYGFSTVAGGMTKAASLSESATRGTVVFICPAIYSEDNITFGGGVGATITVVGGGMDSTIIKSSSTSTYGFRPTAAIGRIIVRDLTFGNAGSAASLAQVYFDQVHELINVRIDTASGGTAIRHANTINRWTNVWLSGTSSTLGLSLDSNSGYSQYTNVRITGYTTGIGGAGGDDKIWNNLSILNCTNAITLTDANFWQMNNVSLETCTNGLNLATNNVVNSQFRGFRLRDVTNGIVNGATITNCQFIDWNLRAVTDTSTRKGVDFTNTAASKFVHCQFHHWNFKGYTSGNEFLNTASAGTGTVGAHNTSDAGTVADFGSPVGHAGSGSGGAASNAEPFVTIGNTAGLSAERALALTPADGEHTFTDGGANGAVTLVGVDASASQKGHAILYNRSLSAIVDATVTTHRTVFGPMPHAGTIVSSKCKTCDGVTVGATAWIGEWYKVLAANVNTDGGTTTIFSSAPTITNGNMVSTNDTLSVTTFAAGDYLVAATVQVGTNGTMVEMGLAVRFT